MSLRWIQENQKAPTCDEESSDIDDSGTDDSYDTDISYDKNDNEDDSWHKEKRDTTRAPTTTVTFDENGVQVYNRNGLQQTIPCVVWDPRKCIENPAYQSRSIKFFCRTGYHLTISPSGRVCGHKNPHDQIANFRVISISFGIIQIQNPETGHYLAYNKKGYLYGELKQNSDNTEWQQWHIGSYEAFKSRKYAHNEWWIGIKKNGRMKPGNKTQWGQKAIQFLVIGQD